MTFSRRYCDAAELCGLSLLLNGKCDRQCASAGCSWDFYDCCEPTFASANQSLTTRTDTTVLALRLRNNGGETPYDAWKTQHVKRYVANAHRLVGGVLFDQQRDQLLNCSEVLRVNWAAGGTGAQVVTALTEDALCASGAVEVATAGTDPTFQVRSDIYNAKLSVDACYPGPGGLDDGGFPFVRFPVMGGGLPLRWGESVHRARAESEGDGFFDVDDESMDSETRSLVEGGYPIYFDCDFDNARAVQYLK